MCATWKLELRKHFCEKRAQLLKKMSKYQKENNNKISKQPITITLKGEDELALLLIGSKKS